MLRVISAKFTVDQLQQEVKMYNLTTGWDANSKKKVLMGLLYDSFKKKSTVEAHKVKTGQIPKA